MGGRSSWGRKEDEQCGDVGDDLLKPMFLPDGGEVFFGRR